jgi:hypothetical protein
MAAAIPFIMAASAAVAAVSAVQQGKAAKAASRYNSAIAEQNAQLSREEAAARAKQHDREMFQRLGAIKANQGKNGGAAGEGSVLDVLGDVAAQGELERQYITYAGELKARGFDNSAALDVAAGRNAQRGATLRAGTELLSGAAGAYGRQQQLNRV